MWNNWDQEHWMSSEEIRLFSFSAHVSAARGNQLRNCVLRAANPSEQPSASFTINCMVAAFAIAALFGSLIYGLT